MAVQVAAQLDQLGQQLGQILLQPQLPPADPLAGAGISFSGGRRQG
jgi:hypothetical protein